MPNHLAPALEATKPGFRVTQFNETRWSPYSPESGYPFEHIDGNWTNLLRGEPFLVVVLRCPH